jgi:hypothetical protein
MQDVRRLKAVEDLLSERSGRTGDCLKPPCAWSRFRNALITPTQRSWGVSPTEGS